MKFSLNCTLEECYKTCYFTTGNYGYKGKSLVYINSNFRPNEWRRNRHFACSSIFMKIEKNFISFVLVGQAINRCFERHRRHCNSHIDALSFSCAEIREYCTINNITGVSNGKLNKLKLHLEDLHTKDQLPNWGTYKLTDFKVNREMSLQQIKELYQQFSTVQLFVKAMKSKKYKGDWKPKLLRDYLISLGFDKDNAKLLKGDPLIETLCNNLGTKSD